MFWGPVSSMQVPRVGMLTVNTSPLLLMEQRLTTRSLLCVTAESGVFGKITPLPLLPISMDSFYPRGAIVEELLC